MQYACYIFQLYARPMYYVTAMFSLLILAKFLSLDVSAFVEESQYSKSVFISVNVHGCPFLSSPQYLVCNPVKFSQIL